MSTGDPDAHRAQALLVRPVQGMTAQVQLVALLLAGRTEQLKEARGRLVTPRPRQIGRNELDDVSLVGLFMSRPISAPAGRVSCARRLVSMNLRF